MKLLILITVAVFSFSSFAFCDLKIAKAALAISKLNSIGEVDFLKSNIRVNSISTFIVSDSDSVGESSMKIEVESKGVQDSCVITKIEVIQFAG